MDRHIDERVFKINEHTTLQHVKDDSMLTIKSISDDLPEGPHICRGMISELEYMDKKGDPSRYMPKELIQILAKVQTIEFSKDDQSLNEELTEELSGLIEAYKELKRT